MRATPLVEHEAQKAAELAEAVAAIPDQEFNEHPAIVALRARLADVKRRLRLATAARAELDGNPPPGRIEQARAELDVPGCNTADEAIKALEAEHDQAEARIAAALEQLKHARVVAEARAAIHEAQRAAAERERQEREARERACAGRRHARIIAARRAAARYQSV